MEGLMYVNGQWTEARTKARRSVVNPATGEPVGSVPAGNREDAALAVDAAAEAFPAWAAKTAAERSALLLRTFELLTERCGEIAETLTKEQGKPLGEAKGEVVFAADFFRWYGEEAKRAYGETIPASASHKRIMVIRQPIGVVAAITPWNFPISMIARKIAPALAAGCTVVLKPADYTPLTAVMLFQVLEEVGFPAGVANLVTGKGSEVGREFVENGKVKKITFTGSTEVGKLLYRDAADQMKRLSLELGGHAPFLVFSDADLDLAADACIVSKFRNAGQTCICANRVYVQESVKEAFTAKLTERTRRLKIGYGLDSGVDIGPLIDQSALAKVEEQVADAVRKGAKVATGGRRWASDRLPGAFYEPTVLTDVDETMAICHEETFGPVAPIITFDTEEEALRMANDVPYGLAAYAFTRDLGRCYRVAEGLEYGIVGMNDPLPSVVQAPFGGWKESGLGREGGHYGMDEYMETKYISLALNPG